MNRKVSIIVPVYNNQELIKRCVKSLIEQTYKNIEIILINDGSKDNTLDVLKKLEKENNNIKVLNQENSGAGKARNLGIKNSSGDYITFVDSDDALEIDAIEQLVNELKENTDIVIGGIKRIDENSKKFLSNMVPRKSLWTELKFTACAFKLYRKIYLKENNLEYKHYKIAEDVIFCLNAFSKTRNIEIVESSKYLYYLNSNSLTQSIIKKGQKYELKEILEVMNKIDLSKYPLEMIEFFYIKTIVQNVIMQLDGFSAKELNEMYMQNYNWLLKKKLRGKYIKLHIEKYETISINLIVNLFIICTKLKISKLLIWTLKKCKFIRAN